MRHPPESPLEKLWKMRLRLDHLSEFEREGAAGELICEQMDALWARLRADEREEYKGRVLAHEKGQGEG